jgi:lysozyme family protein
MADFQEAESFLMHNEDANLAHAIVPDAPPGAHAISGINSVAYPKEYADIAAIPQAQRGSAVDSFYQIHFWNKWEGQLISQAVADRVYDFAVNAGPGTAVKVFQTAINTIGGNITVDGGWGPSTVEAANACDPTALIEAFKTERDNRYVAIAKANPSLAKYLQQWEARAAE